MPATLSSADALQALHRQITYLQREIQTFLDAQSLGLSAGLGHEEGAEEDGFYSKETPGPIHLPVSPVRSSTSERSVSSTRRPVRYLSLPASRRKLHSSLLQLSELKRQESEALQSQHITLTNFLTNATEIENKKLQIESSITEIEAEIEDSEKSLAAEEDLLMSEITALQKKLDESTSRLKHVCQQRQDSHNRRKARLSSWNGALEGVNQQLQADVIRGRSLEDIIPEIRIRKKDSKNASVWNLPRERRTIGLIREEVTERAEMLLEMQQTAELESTACVEGADIWKLVVGKVEQVEHALSGEIGKPDSTTTDEVSPETGMIKILSTLEETVGFLEHEFDIAQANHWNLLVCAVGAELEALRQGKDLLQDTLESIHLESTSGTMSMMTAKSRLASDLTDSHADNQDRSRNGAKDFHHGNELEGLDLTEKLVDQGRNPAATLPDESFHQKLEQTAVDLNSHQDHDENDDDPSPDFFR